MGKIFTISKRGIIAILTLCILLCTTGIGVHAISMPEENIAVTEEITVVVEETTVATEKTTAVAAEEITIATEESTVVTEETTPELIPMMANRCSYPSLNQYLNQNASIYGYSVNEVTYGSNISLSNGYYYHAGQYGSNLQCFIFDSSGNCVASSYLSAM